MPWCTLRHRHQSARNRHGRVSGSHHESVFLISATKKTLGFPKPGVWKGGVAGLDDDAVDAEQ